MIMRTKNGSPVLSFDELSKIIRRKEGEYSWEYRILSYLACNGFYVKYISNFDFSKFIENCRSYMYEYFGEEAAEDQISHSNMEFAVEDAKEFTNCPNSLIFSRTPSKTDIMALIDDGYYLIPFVNQRIFQADDGYVAHSVLVYSYSERGVRMHNPGPPATEATEVAWELFLKAWSSPSEQARILIAAKPS